MSVYLIRHGSAGTRNSADDDDDRRSLDSTGVAQAEVLAHRLSALPISRIFSSPFLRCCETVAPLGRMLGKPVEVDDRLAESTDVDDAWKVLSDLANTAAEDDSDAVVCSHGDLIPDLIRRAQMRGMRIHGKSGCAKGSIWKLDGWDGNGFRSASYSTVRPG